MLKIRFKKMLPDAILPKYAHDGDAAFDICTIEEKELNSGEMYIFSTGLAGEIPEGYFVKLFDRSGLAARHAIHSIGGVIDANYRGEWKVMLVNSGKDPVTVEKGERIVQGVLFKLNQAEIVEVDTLSATSRGEAGFGSSGRK